MSDTYKLTITGSVQKEIRELPKVEVQRILTALQSLSQNPPPSGCKKLVGTKNFYRIRIGNYRVLYIIDDEIRIVEVSGVNHRREAYE